MTYNQTIQLNLGDFKCHYYINNSYKNTVYFNV